MNRSITFKIYIGVSPLGYGQEYHLDDMGRNITFRIWIGV